MIIYKDESEKPKADKAAAESSMTKLSMIIQIHLESDHSFASPLHPPCIPEKSVSAALLQSFEAAHAEQQPGLQRAAVPDLFVDDHAR